eukprot:TRINITY_DN39356_c0_g1_i1.p1 TRINITY_DN39356_c0_g1~~TRINITY_DN39356_c0_g1_i1.p1  ORF type:complete len:325 (-),score=48.73 TRINITY_DN39356_c0_g1_i1:52-1026(-)
MGQAIATTRFFMYGKSHFTQTGYQAHSSAYGSNALALDSVNLKGSVHVVTGANSGIGREIAQYLAGRGGKVYMVCRNAERAEKEREAIAKSTGSDSVHVLIADCGIAADVRRVSQELKEKEEKGISSLVCNAGAMTYTRTLTSEGHEVTYATHLLHGTYLLTEELRPLLEKEDGSRVVVVSSGGMLNVKYDHGLATGAKGSYDRQLSYAYAKRGQVLLCEHWAKHSNSKIPFVSCHPGWTDTPGVDFAYGSTKKWLEPMRTTWEGAEGICWLCVAPREELESGAFYLDRKPQDKHVVSWTANKEKDIEDMVAAMKEETGRSVPN